MTNLTLSILSRAILAALLLAPAYAAKAETVVLSESKNGERVVTDTDRVLLMKGKDGKNVVMAPVTAYLKGKKYEQAVIVTAKACDAGQGPMIWTNEDGTHDEFFWTWDGSRVFDDVATNLCRIIYYRHNLTPPAERSTAPAPTVTPKTGA